ncbi:hypothetical protein [Natrialba asiatica]|uniref:hypothetical protein n=1 Tax=Natrialba asiatica TaxID=64602 RepID=UPI0006780FCA|nr:hypothetical protein [Natrialba asiatica]
MDRRAKARTGCIRTNSTIADADGTIACYEKFDFEESWAFETGDGETTNRHVADENGIEPLLSGADRAESFDRGSAGPSRHRRQRHRCGVGMFVLMNGFDRSKRWRRLKQRGRGLVTDDDRTPPLTCSP